MKKLQLILAILFISAGAFAQNVGINSSGSEPDASAMLDVSSTTSGFLAPRMTAEQRESISLPATGLMIYQTDGESGYYHYNGSAWVKSSSFWTSNLEGGIYSNSNIGIGTTTPGKKLTVNGYMGFVGSTDNRIYFGENDYFRFDDATGNGLKFIYDDVERLRISNDGRLIVKGTYAQPQMLVGHDGSNGLFFEADGSSTHYNWKISQQNQMDGGLTFAPSTAVGGTTFASPVLSLKYNGYVGIGTTDPGAKLHVEGDGSSYLNVAQIIRSTGTTYGSSLRLESTGTNGKKYALYSGQESDPAGAGVFSIYEDGAGDRLVIKNGNIGIGTILPDALLDVEGTLRAQNVCLGHNNEIWYNEEANDVGALYLNYRGYNETYDYYRDLQICNGKEGNIAFFDGSSGNVGIGTTSPNYTLHVNGSVAGTSAYNNLSDARLKTDVISIENGLEKVMQLRPVTFNWKQNDYPTLKLDDRNHVGFIAQEVEKIVPQVVSTANDEMKTKSIAYSDLVPMLTKAIQELQKEIETLNAQNAALIQKTEALTQKADAIDQLKAEVENLKKMISAGEIQLSNNQ